jgi:cytochrome P450
MGGPLGYSLTNVLTRRKPGSSSPDGNTQRLNQMTIADLPRVRGSVIVDKYFEAVDILSSPSCVTRSFEQETAPFKGATVSEVNGEMHQLHRRLAAPAFGRHAIMRYEESVLGEAIERALDSVRRAGDPVLGARADLVRLSQLILVQVAARFVGLDHTDEPGRLEQLLAYTSRLGPGVELRWADRGFEEIIREGLAAKAGFARDFFWPALQRRLGEASRDDNPASRPIPDLISGLCGAEWDEDKKLREAITYMTAGIRATAHIVTRTFDELEEWLVSRPAEREQVYSAQGLRDACNETLRLHPSSPALFREAVDEIPRDCGPTIPPGGRIAIDLLGCNTDISVFGADAAVFRPGRELPDGVPRYGLSFGAGRHVCPGRSVVTANGPVASRDSGHELLRAVARIVSRLHECGMQADRTRKPVVATSYQRRYEFYPVKFTRLAQA